MNRVSFAALAQASVIVAVLALGRSADAKTPITFCNVGDTAISIVTIGDHPLGGWVIDGWRTIQSDDCATVDSIFQLKVGVAVTGTSGERGMQVYDPGISRKIFAPIDASYCVPSTGDFQRRGDTMLRFSECQAGDVLARFTFHLKPLPGTDVTIEIPADQNGDIIPFQLPKRADQTFPPFQPYQRLLPPDASFELASRGLAEQQERLRLRIERQDPRSVAYWRTYYLRDLGIVARPKTRIVSIARSSPADKTGLHIGDEVLRIDDISLQSAWHARSLMVRTRPGESHTITFLRDDELRNDVVTLGTLPAHLAATELHPQQGWLGIEFEGAARVVAVIYQEGTPHLELDDDIMKIGRSDFDGVDGLARWLARDVGGTIVELQVRRRGKIMVMALDKLK
jgi:hypothetical protein